MVDEMPNQEVEDSASNADVEKSEVEDSSESLEPTEEAQTEETGETKSALYDDKNFRQEAEKIRESTRHKVSRKFEKELALERQRAAELEEKLKTISSPPDDESVYDEMLGTWRPKSMGADEYSKILQESNQKRQEEHQFKQQLAPLEERTAKVAETNADFEPTMKVAVQNGLVNPHLVLAAAQEDGGLEILYSLVKENSPKLLDIAKLPASVQAKELWKLTWASKNAPPAVKTSADEPLTPENEASRPQTDYSSLNYRDGYKEFTKNRERGRG